MSKGDKTNLILIVDDVPRNLQVLGSMLRNAEYEVTAATNAAQALNILTNTTPDLILLDVMMPVMDGYHLCRLIRENPAFIHIPIIFLTAKTDMEDRLKGFEAGAVDYILKPFQSAELLARVNTHLALKRSIDIIESMNSRLKIKARELSRLSEEKTEFLQIVAHDLKNPLFNITELCRELSTHIPEKQEIDAFIAGIGDSAHKMTRLVQNILDVNAIESGHLHIRLEEVDMASILHRLKEDYAERARQKCISLHLDLNTELPSAWVDHNACSQILDNLVSNAVKYSPLQKNVYLSLENGAKGIIVRVQDEGPGIRTEELEKLFQKFTRLSAIPTGGESSSGLGLAITKKLTEKLGADIWYESHPDKGATFAVEFPLRPAE